jgi:hypothetical protein
LVWQHILDVRQIGTSSIRTCGRDTQGVLPIQPVLSSSRDD